MNRLFVVWNVRARIPILLLLVFGAIGCTFDTSGNPPDVEACLIVGTKYPLFNPGIGNPAQPEESGLIDQCENRAAAISFRWTLLWTPAGSDTQELLGVFNDIDSITASEETTPQCLVTSVFSNESLSIDTNIFIDGGGQLGTLQVTHSRADGSWSQTCAPIQIDFCPAHIRTGEPDPAPIWASHSTLDVAACEQNNAFAPLDGSDVIDEVPYP